MQEDHTPNEMQAGPAEPPAEGPGASDWDALNARRLELIEKKYSAGGLTVTEVKELGHLQKVVGTHLAATHPQTCLPTLEELDRLADGLRPPARG